MLYRYVNIITDNPRNKMCLTCTHPNFTSKILRAHLDSTLLGIRIRISPGFKNPCLATLQRDIPTQLFCSLVTPSCLLLVYLRISWEGSIFEIPISVYPHIHVLRGFPLLPNLPLRFTPKRHSLANIFYPIYLICLLEVTFRLSSILLKRDP